MNEVVNDDSNDNEIESDEEHIIEKSNDEKSTKNKALKQNSQISNFSGFSFNENDTCDEILSQHLLLQVFENSNIS
jgi:hypothetical protein